MIDLRHLESQAILIALLLLVIVALFLSRLVVSGPLRQRPPGPRGLPFLGNTLQVPSKHFATYLSDLHSQYGGLVYLNINQEHVFSIGDLDLAIDLLDRRSAIYSSRPVSAFFERYADPTGFRFWSFAKSGENHFWGRKISAAIMKQVRAGHTEPLQRLETISFLQKVVESSGAHWYRDIGRMSANVAVAAIFGVNSLDGDAPEVTKVIDLLENSLDIMDPFSNLINRFIIVDDLIPAFIPTPWRTAAEKWSKYYDEGWEELFHEAVEGKGAQMSTWAMMFAQQARDRRHLLSTFARGSIGTTTNALRSFVLAAVAFPEWIETAQQELDRVVGNNRLPTFEDRPSLPFIEATVREVFRWSPSVRMGLPHATTADDVFEYQGKEYFIPKGSTVYCPAFVMERDPNRYESPHIFRPQRFLDEKGELTTDYRITSFGFGRRVCLGIPFAERTLLILVASLLWTFNIRKAADPCTGEPMEYRIDDDVFDGRLMSGPLPFPVKFEPRDKGRLPILRKEWEDSEKDLNVLLAPLEE